MKFSCFAQRFSSNAGIVQLMDDLGSAMAGQHDIFMLGGGNPAHIPEVQQYFYERMQRIMRDPSLFGSVLGNYDPPQGEKAFLIALIELFNECYGWSLTVNNIALSNGSQAAFFMLFNMFAGKFEDNSSKRILLPMLPEYIGYTDVGLYDTLFSARKPIVDVLDTCFFKYRVDFSALHIDNTVGAICVSRPTNPTGNVLTDDEINQLHRLAQENDIPLIIDNAYGAPFPHILFSESPLIWSEHIILSMSLSKLGLPGVRTGIIIANEAIIESITNMNAIINLAQGSFGPALAYDLIKSGEVISLSKNVIRRYYQQRVHETIDYIHAVFKDFDYRIHKVEGAIFLWLWFPGLPISSQQLYERLKQKGVLILAGHHFFPGLEEHWPHKYECIRITYSQQQEIVEQGIQIIAHEIRKL